MTERQFKNRVAKREELKRQIAELKEQQTALEAEIKEFMGDLEQKDAGAYVVHWKKYIKPFFKQTAFKNAEKELYDKYTEFREQRDFRITEAKGAKA